MPRKQPLRASDIMESDESDFSSDDEVVPKKSKGKEKRTARNPSPARRDKKAPAKNVPSTSVAPAAAPSDDELDEHHFNDYDDDDLLNMEIPPQPEPCMRADGTGARLMIKEIIATNFKSYYGSQRIGPFHKNFSAIIGPNGSGKSNVIDSLLFVFGFRANKIRLKKMSELIHNSSGKERPSFCTVEVRFQKIIDREGGDFDVVEGSEFSVAKTAFRDSTCKYTLDGKTRSIKDIVKKLREVGIDLIHNRFLILQGEVEHIAMMKPKSEPGKSDEGMLEYLEDIIGSSRFKEPIERLTKQLDILSADRSQQTQKVKMADKERQAMEGPVREMILFLRCENQVTLIKNKLFHIKLHKLLNKLKEKEPIRDGLVEERDQTAGELKKLVDDRKEAEKESGKIEKEKEKIQTNLDKVQRSITDIEAKETKRKLELKRCTKDIATLTTNLQKEEGNLERIKAVPEKSTAKINMLEGTLEELEEIIKENEDLVDENRPRFEQKSGAMRAQKQKAEEELGEKQTIIDDASSKLTIAQEELQMILADDDRHKKRYRDLQQQLDENQTTLEKKKKEFGEVSEALPKSEALLAEARDAIPQLKKQYDTLNEEVIAVRGRLGEELAAVSSRNQGSATTKVLLAARDSGELPGLIGRLGDLGAIDKKYDAAISTTVYALNSYVVESKADALKGVDICVKNGIGRTNFQILSEVPDCAQLINQPAHLFPAPRMFDLLTIPDERLKKIFYSSIKDTLLVDDLEAAKKIAVRHPGKFRYTTLIGSVMDQNGTISGGGKPKTGAIGSQVKNDGAKEAREAQLRIDEYNKEINTKTEQIEKLSDSMRQSDQRVYQLTKDVQTLREKNRQLKNETQMLSAKVANLEKQTAFQEAQVSKNKVDEAVVEAKRADVDQLMKERDAAREEYDVSKEIFDKAKDKLELLWKELCGRYREKADDTAKKLADTKKDIAKEQGKLKSFERDKNKAEERVNELQSDLENKSKQEATLVKNEGKNEEEIAEFKSQKKELEKEIKECEDRVKEARKANSHMDQEELKLQKLVQELNEKIETIELEIKSLVAETNGQRKLISALKLHRIKDLGILPDKVRKPAEQDHYLDDTLEEEQEHLEKQKKKREGREDGMDDDDSDVGNADDGALPSIEEKDLEEVDREELKFKMTTLEQKIAANKKDINMNIIDEYSQKVKKFEAERDVLERIKNKYNDHLAFQDRLKKQRMGEFMEGFERIGLALKEMYQMITLGGDAALDLKDSMDPFSEGIQFMVRPPKKSWKNIENLSGGEKTLSSLSLVFALHHYRPTPLYVMDEIDAALDFRNVSIIGHYVKDRTKNAQFIIISLRNNMFELGDRLVGIYKTFDCTKNVVIDPARVMAKAGQYQRALQTVHSRQMGVAPPISFATVPNVGGKENDDDLMQDSEATSSAATEMSTRKRLSSTESVPVQGKKLDDRLSPVAADRAPRRTRLRDPREESVDSSSS